MIPLTPAIILQLVLQYGPTIVPLIEKLWNDIQSGRGNSQVTAADLAELSRLSTLKGEDIYAKLGITPPPPATS